MTGGCHQMSWSWRCCYASCKLLTVPRASYGHPSECCSHSHRRCVTVLHQTRLFPHRPCRLSERWTFQRKGHPASANLLDWSWTLTHDAAPTLRRMHSGEGAQAEVGSQAGHRGVPPDMYEPTFAVASNPARICASDRSHDMLAAIKEPAELPATGVEAEMRFSSRNTRRTPTK